MSKLKLFFLFFLVSCLESGTKEQKVYFFYDQSKSYDLVTRENDSLITKSYCWIRKPELKDTFYVGSRVKFFYLMNYFHKEKTLKEDTFFIKGYKYLESIRYFDSAWLSKEENLEEFWEVKSRGYSRYDSALIFMIEQFKNTDSLIFRRVHRYFMTTDD